MINLLVRASTDQQFKAKSLSKDCVIRSGGDAYQSLCRRRPCFCESPFVWMLAMFLIQTNTDGCLTSHPHIHIFLYPAGPTYVRMGRVRVASYLFRLSVLQLVVGDAQCPGRNS